MKFTAQEAGLMATVTSITLTFLSTAPVWEASPGGFPALSAVPGQTPVKDAVLFGAVQWLLGHALEDLGALASQEALPANRESTT